LNFFAKIYNIFVKKMAAKEAERANCHILISIDRLDFFIGSPRGN
jgi:hypothetical protein